ncbi:hypothetical protein AKG95_15405 [Janthinobacterium lividum]|uniref:Bacteriophage tail tape measure N-terminal domain-containing protein n=1 Tax=Janthinobacterium lividum TaxID=29581 RepID=A0A1S1U8T8_9BURK|nr:phage tail length tape measure family protein [Janthinobacterium lividum]OHV96194.1 hypothetical protein AKG95_15405 [Janthinobacterium lividum]
MPDIAELGLSIDTRQLEQGAQAMDRLGTASESVEKKVGSATTAVEKLGKASADAKGKTAEGAAAVDAVGEAGARVVQKVEAATTSIDAMGASATRIRTVFLGGSNTLDGFMGASMGVWRSSEAAAAGIDSLGNATERTWKKQADYNGAMADTTRIMRQAADAARTLEESNHRMLMQLQREIDTFGMARGELERYRAAELGLGSAAQTKAAALGNSIDAMHREERAARDAAGAQDRAAAAGDRFIKSLQDQVATLGMTTQQLQTYRAAQLGVSDAASPLINKLAEAGAGAKSAGGHMEGLSFQSASAKRELLVLAHELSQGQFQRFGGSMLVLGEQTGAASLLFSAAGLAVLGLAAAIATVGYAMVKGAGEQRQMNNALISTNNYAGVTSDRLNEMAHAATEAGGSIREAKKVVTELAGTGKFTGDQIAYISDAIIALKHAGSSTIKKTIAEFESLAVQMTGNGARSTEAITRAALKLDDTYHFLTIEVFAHIRALEKEGEQKAASAVATEEFAKATKDGAEKMAKNLGSVATAWHAVTEAIGEAMSAMGDFAKKGSLAKDVDNYSFRLGHFDQQLKESNVRLGRAPDDISPEMNATRTKIVLGLTAAVEKLNIADAQAIAQGDEQQKKSALMHDMQRMLAADDKRKEESLGRLNVELEKNRRTQQGLIDLKSEDPLIQAMITPEAIEARRLATIKEFSKKPAGVRADQVENTQLADQIKQYEKEAATAKAHYDALGKLDDMYLRGGELSVQQAYENKRSYATKTYEAQIDTYDLELDALTSHNSRTNGEAAKHEKQINEILGKRDAAEKAFFDESFRRDEEERLRQAAIATAASDAANKEIAAINAQVAAVEEQIRTYGLLPAQKTALAVADLEEQKAALASFEGNEKVIDGINRKIEAMKRLGIVQGRASTQEQGGDVAKAKELLDILTAVDTATKSAAQGMTASFGAVGTAIGGLTTALSGYAVQQQAIAAQLAAATKDAYGDPTKVAKAQAAAAQQGAQAQIKSYGDMASSAKGFFKENTAGYRAMEGAEKAYRAVEMAMAIESMVKKLFAVSAVTTATVGGEVAKAAAVQAGVATQLAADTVKGTSAAAVAVATQAQGDPYSAWIRMAAMAAAMAALGFAVSGGGGSDTTAKDRQAATGTGSILGDSSAKSESIAHSLAIMEKNSGLGLAHTISMDSSLKQMVAGIGNLSSLLARSGVTAAGGGAAAGVQTGTTTLGGSLGMAAGTLAGGVGGAALGTYLGMGMAAIGGPLGLAVGAMLGSVLGGVVSKLFNTSTSIKDQGITGKAMSLGNVDALGFTAQAYADVNTKKKAFGISYSSKDSTKTAALSDEMNDQFSMIITSMGDTIRSAADVLGLGGAAFNAHLNSFVVDLGKISLKDLSGEEQQKALETAFSKMGDDMAKFGVAGLAQYQAVGEGYLETLVRVTNDYMQVSDVLAVLGKSFNTTGLGAVALSESLIAAAGGLDKLTSGTGFFVENFLSEAERMAPITKSVNDAMGKLGVSGVTTVDQFKALVLAQDLSTAAGQAMYAQLIAIAEPFKKAADYAAELAAATGEYAAVLKTANEIASEHRDLQQQLNELTKSETELLAIQRSSIAAVNRALFDQVQAAKAVVSAKDALGKAYDREAAAAQTALDKSKSWVSTLNGLNASMALGSQSILTPEQKYAEARAQFEKTLAAANAGDTAAQSGLSAAEQAFLTASQVVNASDARYAADYARVVAANNEALKWASAQVDVQQASLDALKAQVSGLITINDSVLTVAQAIANLQAAMGTATGLGVKFDGSHSGGLANVPFDGYAAELHRGEVVVDAQAASAMRRYFGGAPSQGGGNTDALVAEIKGLREEVKGLRADQQAQTGATIQATVESNDKAAKTVVAGVDKSAKASVWAQQVGHSA